MDFNKELGELSNRLKHNDWFYDISFDKYGRVVVYALWINGDIMREVPSELCGKQVLLHFANTAPKGYVSVDKLLSKKEVVKAEEVVKEDMKEVKSLSINDLTNKLDKLEKVCGTNILGDIFFEAHDGKNAVTNWSSKFPDVRKDMDKLLDRFGFDVIYEELEL